MSHPLGGRAVTARRGPAECNMINHNEIDVSVKKQAHVLALAAM